MSLNVNYSSLFKQGIDTSVLKDVSQEILNRAAQKSNAFKPATTHQVQSIARPVELGIDLYQGRINPTLQKQIAMNNSVHYNFNQTTLNSIQFLNSQAAIKNVDGKYVPVVNNETETQKVSTQEAAHFVEIFTSATAKDKEGSNPFYNGELLSFKKESQDETEKDTIKSIFS